MISEFYGLDQDAFSLSPDLDFLFLSKSHEEAVAHLVYGLEQNEDIILLSGDIGTGKTLALHRLVDQVSNTIIPIMITVTTMDFEQLLRLVLMKLDVEAREYYIGTADLIFRLEKKLVGVREQGRKVLLIIDEGQNLGVEYLESVRLLMNLGQPGGQVLQLVLVGQLGLRDNLNLPQMRQLLQRIRVAYQLEYMTREELDKYIKHRLMVAGRKAPLFRPDALDKIHRLSKGVPRVVNYLAGMALLSGFVEEAKHISASHVEDSAPGAPVENGQGYSGLSDTPDDGPVTADIAPVVKPAVAAESPRQETYAYRKEGSTWRLLIWVGVSVVMIVIAGYLTYPSWPQYFNFSGIDATVQRDSLTIETVKPDQGVDDGQIVEEEEKVLEPAFIVHVASFRDPARAKNFCRELVGMGLLKGVRQITNDRNETWNQVFLGPFATRDSAMASAQELKLAGTISYYNVIRQDSQAD